jgi:hypothetical protein
MPLSKVRQPLSLRLVKETLDAMETKYTHKEGDDDLSIQLPSGQFYVWIAVDRPDEVQIRCGFPKSFPVEKWGKALIKCNEFNQEYRFGRAILNVLHDDESAVFIYEWRSQFEDKLVSPFYFASSILGLAFTYAKFFFEKVEKDLEL